MKKFLLPILVSCAIAVASGGGSIGGGGSGSTVWGGITGTLSSQTDLNTALGLKAPAASPSLTGTVTATAINAGVAANSLTLSTTDNVNGSTSDLIFSTGDAKLGAFTSGAFLFAEGNSNTTKGIQVYNRDAGIGYSYTQMDYSGIRMPSNGSITAQAGQFFIGIPSVEGFGLGHSNGINTYGHLVDAFGDTAFIGGEASNGIYPFNRLFIGSGGVVVGAVTSGPGTVYSPLSQLDIRGKAGSSIALFTNDTTGNTTSVGARFGIASDGKGVMRLPVTAVPTTSSDTCVAGTVAIDASFLYYCPTANTWVRAALSSW